MSHSPGLHSPDKSDSFCKNIDLSCSGCESTQTTNSPHLIPHAETTSRMNARRSTSSPRKSCSSCNGSHSSSYLAGDDHWSKVLQANEIDLQSLPSSLRAIFSDVKNKKSSNSTPIKKFCSRVRRWISRRPTKSDHSSVPSVNKKRESVVSFMSNSSLHCGSEWDRVSLQSVDSCYASQPPSPSKCSSVSSTEDVEPESSFLSCKFPERPSTFQPRYASSPRSKGPQTTQNTVVYSSDNFNPASTWPPINAPCYTTDEAYDSVFSDTDDEDETATLNESIKDCTIPFDDLEFGRCLRVGETHDTFKGRWHGDVLIHKYKDMTEKSTERFWSKVDQLSKIRHENVSLFMGVCPQSDNLAVVTSAKKGPSLYESIHQKRDKMSLSEKIHIARQTAQGMGYLHDKGYVLGSLNSENIHLETKVKICLVDQWMSEEKRDSVDNGRATKCRLSYVAPEIFDSEAEPAAIPVDETHYSKGSDVYAFGTVLYELFGGKYPMSEQDPTSLVQQVRSGRRQDLETLRCPAVIKNLIKGCWHHEPSMRPQAMEISKKLQLSVGLQKRHSSSEPELNKIGARARPSCFV